MHNCQSCKNGYTLSMIDSKIVTIDDNAKVLRNLARQIKKSEFKKYIPELKEALAVALSKEKHGVAIAAPQIGESVDVFFIPASTFAISKNDENEDKYKDELFVNPRIIKHSKKIIMSDEGCLSVPFKYSHSVPRFEKISMQYLDENGEKKTINASGFLARVLQHEYDHLQGILYIDKAHEIIDVDESLKPI